MSRIYFHSPPGTAEVRGSERAWMGNLISNQFVAALNLPWNESDGFFALIPGNSYLRSDDRPWLARMESLRTWLRVGDSYFVVGRYKISHFGAALNTAYLAGSDPIKLFARLHGQCEIHAYVEGCDRSWLAGIIEQGLAVGIYRSNTGWESVIELLKGDDSTPVITSYSVCDSFPNAYVAGWKPPIDADGEEDWDSWYDLSESDRWTLALNGLRSRGQGLRLDPASWRSFYFDHGWDAFKLNEIIALPADDRDRIAEKFINSKLPALEAWQECMSEIEQIYLRSGDR